VGALGAVGRADEHAAGVAAGRAALDAGDSARAVDLLRRAAEPADAPFDALYWLAKAHEAASERVPALVAWRRALAHPGAASLGEEFRLAEASQRVLALSPAEAEHRKAVAAFVAGCQQVIDRAKAADPDLERRALEVLLVGDPTHARTRARLAELGAAPKDLVAASRTGRHIPTWVRQWDDLVSNGSFGAPEAQSRLLTIEEGSGFLRPHGMPTLGTRYVLEAEVRFAEQRSGWIFGFAFGEEGGGTCSAFLNTDTIVLDESRGSVVSVVSSQKHAGAPRDTWHTLAVVVETGRVSVWLNGQPYVRSASPSEGDLAGTVAIMRRGCKAEVRSLWVGRGP
jgi:hypothetical protein